MKKSVLFLVLFSCFFGRVSLAESMSDKLIVAVVDKKLPPVLYEHVDKPWDMGVYSLVIKKIGKAHFSSTSTLLTLSFPIEAIVVGNVKQNLFGTQMTLLCDSKFVTNARVEIAPQLSAIGSKAAVSLFIPVPNSDLNCDGLMIPIRPILEKLISDNKQDWEQDLESDINKLFTEVGI